MTEAKLKEFISFCLNEKFDITAPDSPQRQAVLSNDYAIIPAGAGSGKTTVLTYRFLRLLADDEIQPQLEADQILTITFTKAATANMKARIYTLLKKAVSYGLIDAHHLDKFTDAEISTTDSFCATILREDSRRFGISSDFSVEDEADFEEYCSNEIRVILEDILQENSEASFGLRGILKYVKASAIEKVFTEIAKNHIRITGENSEENKEIYLANVRKLSRDLFVSVKESMEKRIDGFIPLMQKEKGYEADIAVAGRLKDDIAKNEHLNPTAYAFSRKTMKGFKEFKDKLKEAITDYNILVEAESLESTLKLSAYSEIFTRFRKAILLHKRSSGLLTFSDIMRLSIEVLRTNPEVRRKYRTRFRKIMVDEFQDNNEDNKYLIYLLAAKDNYTGPAFPTDDEIEMGKVFMVGDEKQSIYRFRNADVSVFKGFKNSFGEERVLSLSKNYRSEKKLIERINRIFDQKVMPRETKDLFEAEYTPLESPHERVPEPKVKFLFMDGRKYEDEENKNRRTDNALSEAYEIARYIKEEILGKPEEYQVHTKEGLRNPEYSDIAILLRSGTNQSSLEKALRLFGIPFNAQTNKTFTQDALLNDFYNLLQLAVYGIEEDRLSFYAFLKSPFVAVSDKALLRLTEKKDEDNPEEALEERDKALYRKGLSIIGKVRGLVGTMSLTQLIDYFWTDLGYRFFILTEEGNRPFQEHFDYLFSMAADYDSRGKGIIAFLDKIRPMLGEENKMKDYTIQNEVTSGVTIQTIHKSKGLEYPIVFVSFLGTTGNDTASLKYTIEKETGIPIVSFLPKEEDKLVNPTIHMSKGLENRIDNAEKKRLLYVAATRAEDHLIFTATITPKSSFLEGKEERKSRVKKEKGIDFKKNPELEPLEPWLRKEVRPEDNNSLLHYLGEGIGFSLEEPFSDTIECIPFDRVEYLDKFGKKEKKKNLVERDEAYATPAKLVPKGKEKVGVTTKIEEDNFSSKILADDLYTRSAKNEEAILLPRIAADVFFDEVTPEMFPGKTEEEAWPLVREEKKTRITDFGTMAHQTLEDYFNGEEGDYSVYFRKESEKTRKMLLDCALELRDGFLSSSFYKEISSYMKYPEKEFYILDGDQTVEGIIDLLCVSEDKVVIVDYKTDSLRIDSNHRNQLLYYVKAMETIYPGRRIEAYVFYLRDPENTLKVTN